jgi:hypothetical protein
MSGFPGQPKVVVSIMPPALRRDSRTLRQAGSVVRLDYCSILVKGQSNYNCRCPLVGAVTTARGVK